MDRNEEQAEVEALVADMEKVVTRLTNLSAAGAISTGWSLKDGKPHRLVEESVLRLALLEMITLFTGDYDDAKYESYTAVLAAYRESLGTRAGRKPLGPLTLASVRAGGSSKLQRTLALPSGLTFDEAVAWATPYLGEGERIGEIVEYS